MMYFDPFGLIVFAVSMLMALVAQGRVKLAYAKYSQVGVRAGLTGADVARQILRDADVDGVSIEAIPGLMTDHYDPRSRTLRLSEDVYHGRSIASLGIAAHEVGHAIQHAYGYWPLEMRSLMYPVSSLGSSLAFPLAFAGLIFQMPMLLNIGIWLFAAAVAFTLVTLPVEFNASSRAVKCLAHGGYMTDEELRGTRSVLNAAALTYVAAAATALLQLLHLILLARSRE
jgi:Zn-dependent membrane protease YugP